MRSPTWIVKWIPIGCAAVAVGVAVSRSNGQGIVPLTVDTLVRMDAVELDRLYETGVAAGVPAGRARGTALFPGARLAPVRSRGARLVWQGKVFPVGEATVINRFFGARMIRGNVFQGPSWRDGRPALVIDYQDTSRIYARYRDELRQVAPGLYLGLMFDRTTNPPALTRYFALEAGD